LKSLGETRQSLMPVYDPKMLPDRDLQDLIAFLLTADSGTEGGK
jgi:hypothetical protein